MVKRHALPGPAGPKGRMARTMERGFTLIEMLIVVAIVGILAGMATVQLRQTPRKAKEAVLKEDLFVLRDVIDQYFADKGSYIPNRLRPLHLENPGADFTQKPQQPCPIALEGARFLVHFLPTGPIRAVRGGRNHYNRPNRTR